jgi:translation initiation factor 4A
MQTTNGPSDEKVRIYEKFEDMDIPENILRGIFACGFNAPSEIQKRGIKPIADGHDVLAQAQSGTGKTCTFSTGALCRVDPEDRGTQVLILAPTRELATQIEGVVKELCNFTKYTVHAATGGSPVRDDISAIQRGVQIVIGTPGRVYDMMERGVLRRDRIKVLVLDEADQMLEGRFREQTECILNMGFPETTKVALFSATMPQEVIDVAERLLKDPVRILLPPEKVTLEGISQHYVEVEQDAWKFECLCDLYQHINVNQAIIYANTRVTVERLAKRLQENGFQVSFIHGEMDPKLRRECIKNFRTGGSRVLVSSDLLARGIDIQQISLVINYELPPVRENYIHRIGRSGRFGRKGVAINLVTPSERRDLQEIEAHYATSIAPLPSNISEILI